MAGEVNEPELTRPSSEDTDDIPFRPKLQCMATRGLLHCIAVWVRIYNIHGHLKHARLTLTSCHCDVLAGEFEVPPDST